MDEIEFRGKSVMTQEWIYGYYYCDGLSEYILPEAPIDDYSIYEIQRGTSGQLCGISNEGCGIYVGDILKHKRNKYKNPWRLPCVVWNNHCIYKDFEILGNIIDDYNILKANSKLSRDQERLMKSAEEWLNERNIIL